MPPHVLGRVGRLVQTAKTAFAAALSWWLAVRIFGAHEPYFAPLAAILTLQVTVAETISLGAQRLLGVVGGIALSLLIAHFLTIGTLAVGLLVLLGMGTAMLAGFGPQAVAQVAVSALLVMALKGKPGYAAMRLIETVLGAAVAVLVNALLIPSDQVSPAGRRVAELARDLAQDLRLLATRYEIPPEAVARMAATEGGAAGAVQLLEESLQFSPLVRWRRRRAAELSSAATRLRRVASQVRGIARSLEGMPRERRRAISPALLAAARGVLRYGEWVAGASKDRRLLEPALRRLRRENERLLHEIGGGQEHLVRASSVLADLVKLSEDIEDQRSHEPPRR